jgi:hypothetical protein
MADHETFDGHPVTRRQLKITGVGDGLSKAMKLENYDLEAGELVTVILRGRVKGAVFEPDKDSDVEDGYLRIDNIVGRSARIAPANFDQLTELMDEHERHVAEMLQLEEEAKKGVQRMPLDSDEDKRQADEDGLGPDDAVRTDEWTDDDEAPLGSPRNPHPVDA